jgi:hypothetical protein
MTFSLYAATIPTYRQILGSMAGLIARAEAFCAADGPAPADLLQKRLAPDMAPLAYQISATASHSAGAMEGVRRGHFTPDRSPPPLSFAALAEGIAAAQATLAAIEPAEMDGWIGQDLRFEIGDYRMDFAAENFLLSFSQPNFFFHATTAYDILRHSGVAIGKGDFLGAMRVKA